ncbi:hypothetical protein F5878DRAFT_607423 [Lentinula raphanica]|uniref:Uncharacterized protein n=1 Tax=Lentinula raphanica TaxID=153919 RepID=A0AA38PH86_9AGAR|nr:hypothetical protein F5878DRAFT_607423 [Lentinula raphanica]
MLSSMSNVLVATCQSISDNLLCLLVLLLSILRSRKYLNRHLWDDEGPAGEDNRTLQSAGQRDEAGKAKAED